jgi:hypothetical protein
MQARLDIPNPPEVPTRKTRTIYVREEDQPIWEKAKEVIGESLSTHLTNYLRTVVASQKAAAQGAERILLSFRDDGIPKTKAFYGRWLISPDDPFEHRERDDEGNIIPDFGPDYYAVAVTAKQNIVVFNFGEQKEEGKFNWGLVRVFESFEQANSSKLPYGLIATAMEVLGVEIEELDI